MGYPEALYGVNGKLIERRKAGLTEDADVTVCSRGCREDERTSGKLLEDYESGGSGQGNGFTREEIGTLEARVGFCATGLRE